MFFVLWLVFLPKAITTLMLFRDKDPDAVVLGILIWLFMCPAIISAVILMM